jgi:tetratricopeptide (TPR) repeat protein
MAVLTAALNHAATDTDTSALDDAQAGMYNAWDANGIERIRLARKAVGISSLCANAYVLLADKAAVSDPDAIALYRLSMKAGELALGPEFEEPKGEFWGWLQTRQSMRARTRLAGALYQTGAVDEALTHWRALLELNPDDNQGIRYTLALVLLDRGRDDELRELLCLHEDDGGIAITYTRALVAFRGGDPTASAILSDPLRGNRHVPAILSGASLGEPSRGYLTMGGADEATWYVEQAGKAWRETPGAVAWLVETAALPDARTRR